MERFLSRNFRRESHNQLPGLYCNDTVDATTRNTFPAAQWKGLPEGAGGGNIRFYFCDRSGRVVHSLRGYWKPDRLLEEARFALALLEDPSSAPSLRAARREGLLQARESEPDGRERASISRILKGLDENPAGRDIADVLKQVEDDVYLKGAVG